MKPHCAWPAVLVLVHAAGGCASSGGTSSSGSGANAGSGAASGSMATGGSSGTIGSASGASAEVESGAATSGAPSSGSSSGGATSGAPESSGIAMTGASGSPCPSAPAWATGMAYAAGDRVTYRGATYVCVQAHTSEPAWTPDAAPALWTLSSCSGVPQASGDASVGSSGAPASSGAVSSGSSASSGTSGSSGSPGSPALAFFFSASTDTSIDMNWNTNVIQTNVSGAAQPLPSDLTTAGDKTITLAFATGECGSENWAGVGGAAMATANLPLLANAGIRYIVSTGGAAGSFTCGSDGGFQTFVNRWASSGLVGVDFDIEAGQSPSVIGDLIARMAAAHGSFPALRFSLTLATLANNGGAPTAQPLGASVEDSFNAYGDEAMAAVQSTLGFTGASSWPGYLTVNVMTMDYGSPSAGVCVVSGGACEMGQSALQAAYNLHDKWGVPYSAIELTPMLGQNDASGERFTLTDADLVASFAIAQGLAGVHYWSYDRDADCAAGSASATCNSMGTGYAGPRGYLERFLKDGL